MDTSMFPEWLVPYLPLVIQVVYAIVIFVVGWIVSKWTQVVLHRVLSGKNVDAALAGFLASIGQYLVLAATVIIALETVGVATTSLVALLASAGLAIGLALQGNLGHFASGVMILLFRPFTLGEKITTGGHTGKVNDIGLFATTLITADNEKVIIPNGSITSDAIVNYSALGKLRGNIGVGVAYGSDLQKVMEVLVGACARSEGVLENPAPSVAFGGFGASSLDFVVRPWAETAEYLAMLHMVRLAIYDDLNKAGIEIPFDQIVVHQA